MKKRILSLLTAAAMLSSFGFTVSADGENYVSSPNGKIKINFSLSDTGAPSYSVENGNFTLIENSSLGLNLSTGELSDGFTLTDTERSSGNSEWHPIAGDKETVADVYNEKTYTLSHTSGKIVKIEMRAYDTGAAFRYILPEGTYIVNGEFTEYTFPSGTYGEMHIGSDRLARFGVSSSYVYTHLDTNATVPKKVKVENFDYNAMYYMPSVFQYTNGMAVTICEGNLDNYVRMRLSGSEKANTLRTVYYRALENGANADPNANAGGFAEVTNSDPSSTPWRVFVIGDEVKNLPENADIITNLNEAPDEDTYKFSEWVKPGVVLRVGNTTDSVKYQIDRAAEYGYQYVHLDTGWFGAEFDRDADPRLDPTKLSDDDPFKAWIVGDGKFRHLTGFDTYQSTTTPGNSKTDIDIPEICRYGKEKGVGVILYFNAEIFTRKTSNTRGIDYNDIFERFEHWGVSGAKPGFAPYGTQANEKLMQDLIESAARHHLVLTIHDEYVRTGTERTFPNCLTTEGIYGDEAIGRYTKSKQIAEDITTLFTRLVQGPADHTFCYPGKGTKAYALASPILFKSGLHYLYWYAGTAVNAAKKDNISVWYNLPAEWDELKVIEAKLEEYATYARRSGDMWYIGSLSAVDRQLNIPLDFLEKGKTYTAEIWADEIGADAYADGGIADTGSTEKMKQKLVYSKELVTADTTLTRPLGYGNGYAVRIKEAASDEQEELPTYKTNAQELTYSLTEAEKILSDGKTYDSALLENLNNAIAAAKAGYAKETLTDSEAASLKAALDKAIAAMLDVTGLKQKIKYAECLNGELITASSYAALQSALENAKDVLASETKTEAALENAESTLQSAIDGCTLKGLTESAGVWLDELDWTSCAGHSNAVYKNRDYNGGNLQLKINGAVTDVRGVFAHSINEGEAYVEYNIDGKGLDYFEGYVGIDTDKIDMGDVIFKFYGDGELIYETAPSLTGFTDNAAFVKVPISRVKTLRLVADSNGANSGDWAVWGNARLASYKYIGSVYTFSSYDGGEASGFVPANNAVGASAKGVFLRASDDVSVAMKAVKQDGRSTNPHMKKSWGEKAESGQYIHTGLSLAADSASFSNFGLGGKLICDYTDENGDEKKAQELFMNGTAIMVSGGKIYAFGNELCAFEPKKWYSVDIFVNTDTNCETVYLNGALVLDNMPIASTLSVKNKGWKLKGFVDLRFNSTIAANLENTFYFDDLSYGIENEIKVNPGLTSDSFTISANNIALPSSVTTAAQVKKGLTVPDGASLTCTMDFARLVNENTTSYIYYLTGGGEANPNDYNFNAGSGLFSGVSYEGGLGGKSKDDLAITTASSANVFNLGEKLSEGESITIEADILAKDINAANGFAFEPWFGSVATNLFAISGGSFYVTSNQGGAIVKAEPNKWYHLAAVFTYNSNEVRIFANNADCGIYRINAPVTEFTRIKYTGKAGAYVDNVRWYRGEYAPYDEPKIISGEDYRAGSGKITLYDTTKTVGDFKSMLKTEGGTAYVYTDDSFTYEASDSSTISDTMCVAVRSDDETHIAYYTIRNALTPGVSNAKLVYNDGKSLGAVAGALEAGEYTLSADFEAEREGEQTYTMYIVKYNEGRLCEILSKPVTVTQDNPYVHESLGFTYLIDPDNSIDEIKAFIWGENMKPESEVFSEKKPAYADKDAYVILMGDSLGQSYPFRSVYPNGNSGETDLQGWGYFYDKYFGDNIAVMNMTRGGWRAYCYTEYRTYRDNTVDYYTNFHNISGMISEIKAKNPNAEIYIVMSIGTNDKEMVDGEYKLLSRYESDLRMIANGYRILKSGNVYYPTTDENDTAEEIIRVRGTEELGAKLILVSPYTMLWCAPGNAMRGYHEEASAVMEKVAGSEDNVYFANTWPLFEYLYADGTTTEAEKYLVSDKLHFNLSGAELVAQKQLEAVSALGTGLEKYLK